MKNKTDFFYGLLIMAAVIYFPVQAQQKNSAQDMLKINDQNTSQAPNSIVRTIKQDREGNIWIASWQGIFKYDGKSFINITSQVSSARFFSVLEDRKGNFWFASVGSGVYYYNGKSFRNFTTKDGLANDRVTHIYEDRTGNVWFGTEGGASLYDGRFFRNFNMKEGSFSTQADSVHISTYQKPIPEQYRIHNDVNAIIEDKTGKLRFGTRWDAYIYDGKAFTTIINKDGKPFTNVRSIIKDKKGNIWLGGYDGLWRYDGSTFTNFTRQFVGYVYEDKQGNIWTSSESANGSRKVLSVTADSTGWVLSRYDEKSLFSIKPTVTEIANKSMIFGILEDDRGDVLFGTFDGVYRYEGSGVTTYNGREVQK